YDAEQLQEALKYGMYFSVMFGILTFLLNKRTYKLFGIIGIGLTLAAFLLGGRRVPVGPVEPRQLSLGMDWLILAFLGSVVLFLPLEKVFPKYKDQIIMRPARSTDLFYFCFNHLAISAILIFANSHGSRF